MPYNVKYGLDPTTLKFIGGGAAILTGLLIYKKVKNRIQAKQEAGKMDKSVITKTVQTTSGPKTVSYNPRAVAKQLAQEFGLPVDWLDFTTWSENESKIVNILLTIPPTQFKAVQSAFLDIAKMDLQSACIKYLGDNYKKVEALFEGNYTIPSGSNVSALDAIRKAAINAALKK